jgi:hypothetical protein
VARQTSSSSAIAGSVRSGAIFTSTGVWPTSAPAARRARLVLQRAQPGVFGEDTLTAM